LQRANHAHPLEILCGVFGEEATDKNGDSFGGSTQAKPQEAHLGNVFFKILLLLYLEKRVPHFLRHLLVIFKMATLYVNPRSVRLLVLLRPRRPLLGNKSGHSCGIDRSSFEYSERASQVCPAASLQLVLNDPQHFHEISLREGTVLPLQNAIKKASQKILAHLAPLVPRNQPVQRQVELRRISGESYDCLAV